MSNFKSQICIQILVLILILLSLPNSIYSSERNNIYGIHLAQPQLEDIKAASDLVNSNGGKWGYLTLVIQENDRNREKWQNIFDRMRELHLIPIIRLATSPVGENWRRPEPEDAKGWVDFLDSLNWVVKDRYIVLFNEPNHGSEWGGEVDVKSYANVSLAFAKALKEKNKDFFVMLAGFDASAPHLPPNFYDEERFIKEIFNFKFLIFNYLDGWSSHSYPNPAFSGSPYDSGRGTVRTYQWELEMLKRLGVNKELPVFITETGWKHRISNLKSQISNLFGEDIVSEYFKIAFEEIWSKDSRVKAVTPFVFDYQSPPFLEFSWKTPSTGASEGQEFYQQYYAVQSLNKVKGEPEQMEKGEISFDLPKELVAQSQYNFRVTLKNQGQAIWDKDEGYELRITNYGFKSTEVLVSDIKDIRPFEERSVDFSIKTNKEEPSQEIKFTLIKDNRVIFESKPWKFKIDPLPELKVKVDFWPFGKGQGVDFEVQLFDIDDRLVFKKKGVKVEKGEGVTKNIQNIAIDELYRAVILKPGYLPRQTYVVFKTKGNYVKFKSMLPFDFNRDGAFNIKDVFSLIRLLRNY